MYDSPLKREKDKLTAKKTKKTDADKKRITDIDVILSFWATEGKNGSSVPTIPHGAIRGTIVQAGKISRAGAPLKRGLQIAPSITFEWDKSLGKTCEAISKNEKARHYSVVNVQSSKIIKVRPIFNDWACEFELVVNDAAVNMESVIEYLELAGEIIGIGDWRVEKGGAFGCFKIA
ncbi:MAG: hypothetical protein OXG15_09855 [Gammaproteobacteria bacterium]|nr:hypothetical protein [Gammaproteobacteria bacterium]